MGGIAVPAELATGRRLREARWLETLNTSRRREHA